eukprot:15372713-Heterocapsa_arctica.AAC.1
MWTSGGPPPLPPAKRASLPTVHTSNRPPSPSPQERAAGLIGKPQLTPLLSATVSQAPHSAHGTALRLRRAGLFHAQDGGPSPAKYHPAT